MAPGFLSELWVGCRRYKCPVSASVKAILSLVMSLHHQSLGSKLNLMGSL